MCAATCPIKTNFPLFTEDMCKRDFCLLTGFLMNCADYRVFNRHVGIVCFGIVFIRSLKIRYICRGFQICSGLPGIFHNTLKNLISYVFRYRDISKRFCRIRLMQVLLIIQNFKFIFDRRQPCSPLHIFELLLDTWQPCDRLLCLQFHGIS